MITPEIGWTCRYSMMALERREEDQSRRYIDREIYIRWQVSKRYSPSSCKDEESSERVSTVP